MRGLPKIGDEATSHQQLDGLSSNLIYLLEQVMMVLVGSGLPVLLRSGDRKCLVPLVAACSYAIYLYYY